jgi:hypothetical protein
MRVLLPAPTQDNPLERKMNGASMSAISRIIIAAAAGLVWSVSSAAAADLGGNCCADLEERIAELEATTARKGNRKVSLTVSGQVSRSILYWNDGDDSGTYAGLDNHNQSTRFVFSGTAKIRPDLTAGFEFMTEWSGGARTSTVDQLSPDGNGTGAAFVAGDGTLNVRTANWWLEDPRLGRVTVGRINVGGPVGTIDLGGISTGAHFAPTLVGGAFFVAGTTRLSGVIGPVFGGDRIEGIRWDSPSIHGFLVQATWGEDDVWSTSLRYAGDFSGFRLAAGIGYEAQNGTTAQVIQLDNGTRNIDHEWSGSLALMHTATGLFVQGHYAVSEFLNSEDGRFWLVQGGISRNWFGFGNTSLYGEYGKATDFIKAGASSNTVPAAATFNPGGFPDANSDVKFYGVGVVQQIDAAAMELFIGWRRFNVDVSGLVDIPVIAPTASAGNGSGTLDLVHGGARIRF